MRALKIMNAREKESLLRELCEKFSLDRKHFDGYVLMENKDEVWISNKSCLTRDLTSFQVDSVGMLFARKKPEVEMTVNAVQLFCSSAYPTDAKNILNLGREDALNFIRGLAVPVEMPDSLYIVTYRKSALDLGHVKKNILSRNKSK